MLVLDEPVSALDVSIQAQILALLDELRGDLGLTYVFIAHDLAVVERFCDRLAVMRDGEIVEEGTCGEVYRAPAHAYTRGLLDAATGWLRERGCNELQGFYFSRPLEAPEIDALMRGMVEAPALTDLEAAAPAA